MKLTRLPPLNWDTEIAFPLQSVGYAETARALGYEPLYARDADGIALVLVRRVPVPIIAKLTARARVFAHARSSSFVPALIEQLRRRGISHVKLGNSVWGLSGSVPHDWKAMRPVMHDIFVHDLSVGADAILANAARIIRRHVRKAIREITVTEVETPEALKQYIQLAGQTGERMRSRDVPAVYPPAYFQAIFREMVPRRQAVLFLAHADGVALAGSTFVASADRFTQIHGCSTRDRDLTPKNGPTGLFWHAIGHAIKRGCRTFDMGAVTPTTDAAHPHFSVFEYKRHWGGELQRIHSAEVVVAPWKHRLQERLLAPLWDRLHPVYLSVFAGRP